MVTSLGEGKLRIQTSCEPGEGWDPPGYSYPIHIIYTRYWHNGLSVRQWTETPGFNPRLSHTKDSNNAT